MSWSSPRTWVTDELVTASIMNTHVRDNLSALQPSYASVGTSQTTSSTSYTDLATSGPAVTVTTGTAVLVTLSAKISSDTSGSGGIMGVAVSGATTLAAAESQSLHCGVPNASVGILQVSCRFVLTGLTAGSNTFTAKYKRNVSGTASFENRYIIVESPF